jgi:hypothetical protein
MRKITKLQSIASGLVLIIAGVYALLEGAKELIEA